MNLRGEFFAHKDRIRSLVSQEEKHSISVTEEWRRNRCHIDREFNLVMRETIMGFECYVRTAVLDTLRRNGGWNSEAAEKVQSPSRANRNICRAYYHELPSLIDPSISLKEAEPKLWEDMVVLYREVRNSIFHGSQATDVSPSAMGTFVEHYERLYTWIDSWHSFEVRDSRPVRPPHPLR